MPQLEGQMFSKTPIFGGRKASQKADKNELDNFEMTSQISMKFGDQIYSSNSLCDYIIY